MLFPHLAESTICHHEVMYDIQRLLTYSRWLPGGFFSRPYTLRVHKLLITVRALPVIMNVTTKKRLTPPQFLCCCC